MAHTDPCRLGANWDGQGVQFSVFSAHATAMEVCLYGPDDLLRETRRIQLRPVARQTWCGYADGVGPGWGYGLRVSGPYNPDRGHRFNPHKLLLDPYARAVAGTLIWDEAVHGYVASGPVWSDRGFDERDSAAFVPRGVVIDPAFDWGDDRHPRIPWRDTVIYECHVKGLTARHPEVAPELRGTYQGLASPPVIDHLKRLGVTTVELLPVQHFVDEYGLTKRGLVNYWGYNPLAFFAPAARYATSSTGGQVAEFKEMVKRLHAAGLEVILDVVFNHTAEGDRIGPTLSFRGLDNLVYYRLVGGDLRRYENLSGCGNAFHVRNPRGLQVVMDSLRYWVEQMHVDGFRFDLGTILLRGWHGVERDGVFASAVMQDPVLSQVKMIAEPWDLGHDGYMVGGFPVGWAEWNDKYRATVRSMWRGDPVGLADMGCRIAGSSDLYAHDDRGPLSSINYVTSHDGFTLADLVSYDHKHNEANGEHNRDGTDHNLSRNFGAEGPTQDKAILAARQKAKRSMVATLAMSLGVPMITAGDEMGRSQQGNNNAFCQDNELSWLNWVLDEDQEAFLAFVQHVLAVRRSTHLFRRDRFFEGEADEGALLNDVTWLGDDGEALTDHDWHDPTKRVLGALLHVRRHSYNSTEVGPEGAAAYETAFLVLNPDEVAHRVVLPGVPGNGRWRVSVDSAVGATPVEGDVAETIEVEGGSVVLLMFEPGD